MAYRNIRTEIDGGVGRVVLDRPESLNALNLEAGEELLDALHTMRSDPRVRTLVITGAGRAFCAGGDVKEMRLAGGVRGGLFERLLGTLNATIMAIAEMPKPVVAAVNGVAAGLGFNLALAADVRIAARGAIFSQAFLRIGLVPDGGGTFLLPRAVGWAKAMELVLTGDDVSAVEAHRIGVVTEVVDDDGFAPAVDAWARRLAVGPTAAIGRAKQLFAYSRTADLESQLRYEREMQLACVESDDFREGLAALSEKRQPRFTGR